MHCKKSDIFHDIFYQPYDDNTRFKLYTSVKANLHMTQRLALLKRLYVHNGCVNSICWNNNGELILSGSDDRHLVLTNAYNYQVLTDYKTSHRANIFSAKFLPNSGDHRIVSCSGDGIILYTDLMRKTETYDNQFTCHSGTTYEIATIAGEPYNFLSCGEDGTVRLFDLRSKEKCDAPSCREDVLIFCQSAVTAISINPMMSNQIAVGCSDSTVKTYDRRMLSTANDGRNDKTSVRPICSFTVPAFGGNSYRITSLSYSPDGQDVLVSYSSDHLYLFSVKDRGSTQLSKSVVCNKGKGKKQPLRSPQPIRRLRLRGDWSDTGPDARPEREGGRRGLASEISQARPVLQNSLMQRMTDVLSRMLNDPATRAALNGGGELSNSIEGVIEQHAAATHSNPETGPDTEPQNHEMETEDRRPNNTEQDQGDSLSSNMHVEDIEIHEESNRENLETNDQISDETINQENVPMETESSHEFNRDRLSKKHSSEPTKSLTYSEKSPTNATISLGMTDDVTQENCHSAPLTSDRRSNTERNESDSNDGTIEILTRSATQNIPTESESSNIEKQKASSIQSFRSLSISRNDTDSNENMMENLQDKLTTMRDGFLERHGSEPAVSLTYSNKSSTSATILVGMADEMTRDTYHPEPSSSSSKVDPGPSKTQQTEKHQSDDDDSEFSDDPLDSGPSKYNQYNYSSATYERTDEDVHNDSDNEDAEHLEQFDNSAEMIDKMERNEDTYSSDLGVKQKYMGHRNARTMIKEANFWGNNYVMSGSDCGHVFIWERESAKLCMLLEADQHVVNCLQPHPYLPILASSGIDYDVKLWAPVNSEPSFNEAFADDLKKRNAVMLEETKDTITVPAVFMIRMLACLNQIRRGRGRFTRRNHNERGWV